VDNKRLKKCTYSVEPQFQISNQLKSSGDEICRSTDRQTGNLQCVHFFRIGKINYCGLMKRKIQNKNDGEELHSQLPLQNFHMIWLT
jgi:hypothetical protein